MVLLQYDLSLILTKKLRSITEKRGSLSIVSILLWYYYKFDAVAMVRTYNQTNASSLGGYFESENGTQRIHPQVSRVYWLDLEFLEYNIQYYTLIEFQKMS